MRLVIFVLAVFVALTPSAQDRSRLAVADRTGDEWPPRLDDRQSLSQLRTVLRLQEQTGLPVAEVLETGTMSLDQRGQVALNGRAEAAAPRARMFATNGLIQDGPRPVVGPAPGDEWPPRTDDREALSQLRTVLLLQEQTGLPVTETQRMGTVSFDLKAYAAMKGIDLHTAAARFGVAATDGLIPVGTVSCDRTKAWWASQGRSPPHGQVLSMDQGEGVVSLQARVDRPGSDAG